MVRRLVTHRREKNDVIDSQLPKASLVIYYNYDNNTYITLRYYLN